MRMRAAVLAVLIVTGSVRATAQTGSEGSLRGYVRDEHGAALPGVTLTATSPTVAGARTAVSGSDGFFRLLDLPPGDYTVTAELEGFAKFARGSIVVRAGLNLTFDVAMNVGTLNETVEVRAETPLLESKSAVQAVNISGDFQRALPLTAQREAFGFLSLTPGAVNYHSPRAAPFYIHGADMGSHVIQIDGADIAAAAQSSHLYLRMTTELIEDVQVKAGGVDASAPLGQGAVINIVTQSGTNQLRGSATLLHQPRRWSSDNSQGGTASAYSLTQPQVSGGGPFARDVAWWFGSYQHRKLVQGVSRDAAQLANLRALSPGYEPEDQETIGHETFIKPTVQLTLRHQLQGFHQYGEDASLSQSLLDERAFQRSYLGGHSASGRLLSTWGSSLTTRVGVAYSGQSNPSRLFRSDVPTRRVYRSVFSSGGILAGNTQIATLDNQNAPSGAVDRRAPASKLTITGDLTYYRKGWAGSHELQAGAYIQPTRVYQFTLKLANRGYTFEELVLRNPESPEQGTIPFRRRVYESDQAYDSAHVLSTNHAFYVQDAWSPNARLTVNAGVRADRIERTDQIFDAVVQRTWAIGPRLGANFLLTADGRNIARASWNKRHDAVSSGSGITAGTNSPGYTDSYDLGLDGVFETHVVVPRLTALTVNRIIDLAGYRQAHVDEWLIGYQRQLPGQIGVDASFIHREFRNQPTLVEVNGIYDDNVFRGYRDEAFNEVNKLTSNTWNYPVYKALQFQVAKRSTRLQLLASYVRQWRHLAGTWQPNDPAAFIQPEAFSNDKGIGLVRDQSTNGLSGTSMSSNEQWRDHAFRFAATVQVPWRFQLSSVYILQSGSWVGPIVTRMAAADPAFGPALMTLSNGRVVSNPLATTIRFAFPTRGDGQFATPWLHLWNLRAGRQFTVGRVTIEPEIDVQNLLNLGVNQTMAFNGANQLYSPMFGVAGNRQPPRSVQVSARIKF